jgi:gamma-glutamyltranspeptidase/glutathione hydrolase
MAPDDPTLGAAIRNPSWRPTVMGTRYAASTGHYLATLAAMHVLQRGGNAIDAGVTAAMALAVLQPDMVSFAGVAPTLIYLRKENRVVSLAGLGYWPAATDKARLLRDGGGTRMPDSLLRTVVPAAPATHIEALKRYGTLSFETAATPAMELARDGFAVYPLLAGNTRKHAEKYRRWESNAAIFLPGDQPLTVGTVFRQTDLARSIQGMIDAERGAGGARATGLQAAHDYFYRGPIADTVHAYHAEHGGFMRKSDLEGYATPVEESLRCTYKDIEVHGCDVWCQSIVLLETLKILEGVDLKALGHNSPAYVHTLTEAMKLAFADREAYVGDPKFVNVPTAGLLSKAYAEQQRARIDPRRATPAIPEPGLPSANVRPYINPAFNQTAAPSRTGPDTIYCCVIDGDGNAYSATLSDNSRQSPVIPGTGMVMSCRGSQSRLEPGHPSEVAPGKRPRLTPNPALAFRNGKFLMAWGTPGGDVQIQAMLQVFLNVVEWDMPLQQAIESPRFATFSFPSSFSPYAYYPGRLNLEGRFPQATIEAMRRLGHDVEVWPDIVSRAGAVCAVKVDPDTGLRHAGADPRREGYAMAW